MRVILRPIHDKLVCHFFLLPCTKQSIIYVDFLKGEKYSIVNWSWKSKDFLREGNKMPLLSSLEKQ